MKKRDVQIGRVYIVKVSGLLRRVRLISESAYGGWNGTNLMTGKSIRIRTAGRLRCEAIDGRNAAGVPDRTHVIA